MRLSRVRLYDLPLLLGIPVGIVVGLLFGDLVASIALGFTLGNVATYGLRYQSGSSDPSLRERMSSRFNSQG
jgi:hypothetical protein